MPRVDPNAGRKPTPEEERLPPSLRDLLPQLRVKEYQRDFRIKRKRKIERGNRRTP